MGEFSVSGKSTNRGVVGFSPHQLRQSIVRIVMIHRSGRDELVLDEHRGRNRALIEDIETYPD